MSKETKRSYVHRQLHPVVLRYVGSDLPLEQIIRTTSRPRDTLLRALLLIEECLSGKRLAKDAITAAKAVPIRGSDPELLVLLLSGWATLEQRIAHQSQADALLHRATALLSENTPYEIRAEVMLARAMLNDASGNKQKRDTILNDILETIPSASPRKKFYRWQTALFLALQGRGKDAATDLDEIYRQCDEQLPENKVNLIRFIDDAETGRWNRAGKILRSLPRISSQHIRPPVPLDLSGYGRLIDLATDRNIAKNDSETETEPRWIRIARSLKSGDAQSALDIARMETENQISSVHRSGFRGFDLVRAELSAGNWEAAERLMDMRNMAGNYHYLDSLFRSRARLLAGDQQEASALFAKTIQAVQRYNANGRLDLELKLAAELSHFDIVRLTGAAAQKTQDRRPQTKQKQKARAESAASSSTILGVSREIKTVRQMVERFADSPAPVLITGETGTGKELVAKALHETSSRSKQPFIPVNCGAIAETLLESELFGHRKGAFTGAEKANNGLFREAGEGTILLDEIGEIPMRLQTALLRVLETGEIRSVGSATTSRIKCRILAATNVNLNEAADNNNFRKDLLFRLQRLMIHIPPLRDRKEDIMLLAQHFLDLGRKNDSHAEITEGLEHALMSYNWPGNVRELRNVIERMRLMHSDKLSYNTEDLDLKFRNMPAAQRNQTSPVAPHATASGVSSESKEIDVMLRHGKPRIRRLDNLKNLFKKYRKLTRSEIVRITGFSPNTITKDLKDLINNDFIERVEPSRSTRSHYFILKETPPDNNT
ncbi:MAG: sigma 54-interacting transcriptional regulator [Verrucomicrobiota bacterium]